MGRPREEATQEPAAHPAAWAASGLWDCISKSIGRTVRKVFLPLWSALVEPHAGGLSFGLPNKSQGLQDPKEVLRAARLVRGRPMFSLEKA